MKILFFGDINGKTGRHAVAKLLPELRATHVPDLVMTNAENLAHGKGVTLSTVNAMLESGIDFFTSGNHVFDKPEGKAVFEKWPERIIRPANVPAELPGKGFRLITVKGVPILVINLLGQAFMEKQFDLGEIGNPFLALNEILASEGSQAKIRIVDFHAEATSEKRGMGFWADGRVSAVLGTHTHVPTADAQILPQGTGYLTDVGMVAAADSVIGVAVEPVLKRFLNPGEVGLEIAESEKFEMDYVVLQIDEDSGKCLNISSYRQIV
jgi:metallophosphoesterase (TIGR00282 family)